VTRTTRIDEREPRTFGEGLRRARRRAGCTLGQLAEALRLTATELSDIERGHAPPLNGNQLNVAARALLGHDRP
jgi:transcriptional regulator with XRE-family HTH domain